MAGKVVDETADESAGQVSMKAVNEMTDESAEKAVGKAVNETADESAEKASTKAVNEMTDESMRKVATKSTIRAADTATAETAHEKDGESEDSYVKLARETLEHYIRHDRLMPMPAKLPAEMLTTAAGAFVSLKKHGELRGCIGTIMSTQENVALEIMYNAISAGTRDPRFLAVTLPELPELVYSVDILSPAEPVADRRTLDCNRYGVIVSCGRRRGLLLPNLEGVETVAEQIDIACRKAGIAPWEDFTLERFEVIRHQ